MSPTMREPPHLQKIQYLAVFHNHSCVLVGMFLRLIAVISCSLMLLISQVAVLAVLITDIAAVQHAERGATLSIPITIVHQDITSWIHKRDESSQVPLQCDAYGNCDDDEKQDFSSSSSPLYAQGAYVMILPLSIGNPPQSFYTILSLHASDLFIVSSGCRDESFSHHNHYNSSLSSTYIANSTAVNNTFWNAIAQGFISRDSIHLSGHELEGCYFAEAITVQHRLNVRGAYFEGVLGLGPKYGNSTNGQGNLVTTMYDQGLIPRNLFSMRLPHRGGDVGELILGGTSEGTVADEVAMIPVTTSPSNGWDIEVLTNTWQVSASGVFLGDGSIINKTLEGYTAWIESEVPWIGLPKDVVDALHKHMHARAPGYLPIYILDCAIRHQLSDLVFLLGGEEFRMSPFDYTIQAEADVATVCYSVFLDMDSGPGETPTISLGAGFLRGFETIFDLERDMVGFKELLNRS